MADVGAEVARQVATSPPCSLLAVAMDQMTEDNDPQVFLEARILTNVVLEQFMEGLP